MHQIRYICLAVVSIAFLSAPLSVAYAIDEDIEAAANAELQEMRHSDAAFVRVEESGENENAPDLGLMKEKEGERSAIVREEEAEKEVIESEPYQYGYKSSGKSGKYR